MKDQSMKDSEEMIWNWERKNCMKNNKDYCKSNIRKSVWMN